MLPRRVLSAVAITVAIIGVQAGSPMPVAAQAYGYDCAHGPDTYRLRGVASWDRLNVRSGPGARRPVVGSIPATGSGVHCLGPCKGKWCRVSWRGIVGWTNMRFLGE